MSCIPLESDIVEGARSTMRTFGRYTVAMITPFPVKPLTVASLVLALDWLHIPTDKIGPLLLICGMDFVSGVLKAVRTKTLSSRKMRMIFPKISVYGIALITTGAGAHFFPPLEAITGWVMGLIAATEILSTLENLSCAGCGGRLINQLLKVVRSAVEDQTKVPTIHSEENQQVK